MTHETYDTETGDVSFLNTNDTVYGTAAPSGQPERW